MPTIFGNAVVSRGIDNLQRKRMQPSSIRAPIVGVLIITTCAYLARAYLQIRLDQPGYATLFAKDLSFLIVPPLLAILLFPVIRSNKDALLALLTPQHVNIRLVLAAIAIGVLARIAWWCQLTLRVALGITSNADPAAIEGPIFSFTCPPLHVFVLGLIVWFCLVPVVEEVVHRGLIQATLMRRGRWFAILVSAALFAAFHLPASMPVAFVAGVVFGVQFANTRTLWTTIATHATYDGLIQFDRRCLNTIWNPPLNETPMPVLAVASFVGLALCAAGIYILLTRTGALAAPRSSR